MLQGFSCLEFVGASLPSLLPGDFYLPMFELSPVTNGHFILVQLGKYSGVLVRGSYPSMSVLLGRSKHMSQYVTPISKWTLTTALEKQTYRCQSEARAKHFKCQSTTLQ